MSADNHPIHPRAEIRRHIDAKFGAVSRSLADMIHDTVMPDSAKRGCLDRIASMVAEYKSLLIDDDTQGQNPS